MKLESKQVLKDGLEKVYRGYRLVNEAISHANSEGEKLTNVFNGDAVDAYKKCFTKSFDEEPLCTTIEYLDDKYDLGMKWKVEESGNQYVDFLNGLDSMVEGADKIAELSKNDKELKKELSSDKTTEWEESVVFNYFKEFGVVGWAKALRGWRQALRAGLKIEIGRYQFSKILKEM